MSEAFVLEESQQERRSGTIALNARLFRSLPFFLKLLPLSLLAILVSSAAPSLFRWYSGNLSEADPAFSILGLLGVTAVAVLFRILAWALFEISGMWDAQRLHRNMVRSLGGTRTTFFDENPSGRLINRLIRDYEEVRTTAIIFVGDFLNATVEVLAIGMVAFFANPWATVLIFPLLGIFSYIQYQRSGMLDHARGFAAIATGKVLGRENDLIEGREVFLLYGQGRSLLTGLKRSFTEYVRASGLTAIIESWASFWMRLSAEVFSFSVLLLLAAAISEQRISAPLAGVIISSLFGITGSIGWLDFATSYVSRSAPHVRRVFEFIDLPPEEAEERASSALMAEVAAETGVRIENYRMSYRVGMPVILDGLSLTFLKGSKTALVGRTGSGKTSVFQALLRMVYVHHGDIRIDGKSVFGLAPAELRRRFGVVPQSPYLFAGTIRSNLDRTGSLPAESLERALRAVGLGFALDAEVTEGGQNLSLGERQLVCLARVIAAGREFILMDEPTSGLDPETDARISRILRTELRDKTVIMIAHRLESLSNYDRVVELSQGRVTWEGTPADFRRV